MIEGGGLGVFPPDEVGPIDVQVAQRRRRHRASRDEAEAVAAAKQYLSYFQGPLPTWECADQRTLRHVVPENRLRIYDDPPRHRGPRRHRLGARAAPRLRARHGHRADPHRGPPDRRHRQQPRPPRRAPSTATAPTRRPASCSCCDAFDIPILVLCDTPGIMVGPEIEKTGARAPLQPAVRHRRQPVGPDVHGRAAQGLRARRAGDGRRQRQGAVLLRRRWPTGEFGGMGLEGQVKLGYRNELANIADPAERTARFDHLVAEAYERSKAIHQGVVVRRRRRHRPGRHPPLAGQRPALRRRSGAPGRAAAHRRLVRSRCSALEVDDRAAAGPHEVGRARCANTSCHVPAAAHTSS